MFGQPKVVCNLRLLYYGVHGEPMAVAIGDNAVILNLPLISRVRNK
jgi:hypothetical protein